MSMLVFRSLTLGLLGACVLLLARRPPVELRQNDAVPAAPPPPIAATIVDVAAGVSPELIPSLVRLRPGEHVTAIDDTAVGSDLEAGGLLPRQARVRLSTAFGGGTYGGHDAFLDLTVTGADGPRRVLVLLH
jgi:hypothetical protein